MTHDNSDYGNKSKYIDGLDALQVHILNLCVLAYVLYPVCYSVMHRKQCGCFAQYIL